MENLTAEDRGAEKFEPTARTRIRRLPQRGAYERGTVYRILDEGLVCHVGFVSGGGPFVIPTGEPSGPEMKRTFVLKLPLAEASAKVRTGPPADDEADYGLPVWAGEIPLRLTPGVPVADPRLAPGHELPTSVRDYSRAR